MILLQLATILLLTASGCYPLVAYNITNYWEMRDHVMKTDIKNMIGNDVILTDVEQEVNEILLEAKMKDLMPAYNTSNVLSAKSFFLAKHDIDQSDVYKLIKKMPKGAILHSHDMALCPVEWIISELTYWPNLYMCYLENDRMHFKFFTTPDSSCDWRNVQDERATYIETGKFDSLLKTQLSIITDTPDVDYPTLNSVWAKFGKVFESLSGILGYEPAWRAYLVKAMQFVISDNVQYFEFRGILFPLYDLEGNAYPSTKIIGIYRDIINNFTKENPNEFIGARFIYAPMRNVGPAVIREYAVTIESLRTQFPDFVAGFDLVGQEDVGKPLRDFIEPLLELQKGNITIPTFFHAGETNWEGTDTDENLFDAILLNTTRIGHGYAIAKHPYLMELIKERNIPIEVCPISNQVLNLVDDLRNHPMAALVTNGYPLVISSDDPGLWGSDPLSHDFYEAFFALAGTKGDLRFLKKMAMNSIRYSTLDTERKTDFENLWKRKWDTFISDVLKSHIEQKDPSYVDIIETLDISDETNYISNEIVT